MPDESIKFYPDEFDKEPDPNDKKFKAKITWNPDDKHTWNAKEYLGKWKIEYREII